MAPDGSVEWLCLPRPDSPSVFGALLDRTAGVIPVRPVQHPRAPPAPIRAGDDGAGDDLAYPDGVAGGAGLSRRPAGRRTRERRPGYRRAPHDAAATGTLVRVATCIAGRVEIVANCVPLFDYGSTRVMELRRRRLQVDDDPAPEDGPELTMTSSIGLGVLGDRCYARTTLEEGQSGFVALSWRGSPPATTEEAFSDLATTVEFWRNWLGAGTFPDHPWRPYLERSALTFKGLSYAPTGAIMAASTTSLPETPGGARNWDYRYTWIRDSAFMLRSLYRLGFDWEALEYFAFVLEAVSGGDLNKPFQLQIMYGIGGERDLTEQTLDHLSGYRGSRPVRVGNGAWDQHQNDVWGMLLDAVDTHLHQGGPADHPPVWEGLAGFVDDAIAAP